MHGRTGHRDPAPRIRPDASRLRLREFRGIEGGGIGTGMKMGMGMKRIRQALAAYLVSPCSSAPFRWGRSSCLGLRTGVSPHFSMNSMREILALRGGYERGLLPPSIPMPTGIHWPPATPSHSQPPKWPLPLALRRHLEVTSCGRQD